MQSISTEETIDYIVKKIRSKFPNNFAAVSFGDVGIYTPDMFKAARGISLPIVAISPQYDRLVPETRTVASEVRARGIDVITIVNMIDEFEARPEEAVGERSLVKATQLLIDYLGENEMVTLDGQVSFVGLGDITWEWLVGDRQILR